MSWNGFEPFDVNTGQFTTPPLAFLPSSATNPTLAFTGGQGVVSIPNNGTYSAPVWMLPAAGDPDDNSYVAIDLVSYTFPGGQAFDVMDVCLVKDGSNGVFLDANVSSTSIRVGANFGGSRNYGSPTTTPVLTVPYSLAISWQGNIFSAWMLVTGTGWVKFATWDVTAFHDFTAVGGRVGWRPGFIPACQPNQATFVVDNLRWGPISDLSNDFLYLPPTNLATYTVDPSQIGTDWVASQPFSGSGLPPPSHYAVYRNGVQVGVTTGLAPESFLDVGTFLSNTAYVYTVSASDSIGTPLSAQSAPLTVFVNPVSVYGKFVGAKVFTAVEISRVGDIIPRIWPTKKNNTVYG
jgi:hypothetical protein